VFESVSQRTSRNGKCVFGFISRPTVAIPSYFKRELSKSYTEDHSAAQPQPKFDWVFKPRIARISRIKASWFGYVSVLSVQSVVGFGDFVFDAVVS